MKQKPFKIQIETFAEWSNTSSLPGYYALSIAGVNLGRVAKDLENVGTFKWYSRDSEENNFKNCEEAKQALLYHLNIKVLG